MPKAETYRMAINAYEVILLLRVIDFAEDERALTEFCNGDKASSTLFHVIQRMKAFKRDYDKSCDLEMQQATTPLTGEDMAIIDQQV